MAVYIGFRLKHFLIREFFNWFAHSVQRPKEYKDILEIVGFDSIQVETEELENNAGVTATVERRSMKLIPLCVPKLKTLKYFENSIIFSYFFSEDF